MTKILQSKMTSYTKGILIEHSAAWLLRFKGYQILARRFKTRMGEIDMIARKGNHIVFVEVKKRPCFAAAVEAVSLKQQQRIEKAAQLYLAKYPEWFKKDIRFDVIAFWAWRWCHIKNAWMTKRSPF